MTIPSARAHTAGVVGALEAGGLSVGVGIAPDPPTLPYVVLYPSGLSRLDGPMSDMHADARPVMQVTSVGSTVEQVEWARDKAAQALLAGTVTIAGRVLCAAVELETSQPVQRDDDVSPPLFFAADIYRFHTTPA